MVMVGSPAQCTLNLPFCRIPPWSLKLVSSSPAISYVRKDNFTSILNLEHLYRTMPSHNPHPDMTPVIRNIHRLENSQIQLMSGPSWNSPLPPAKRCVSVFGGKWDSSEQRSSVASPIESKKSTPSSLLNNSRIADMTQCLTSTASTSQGQ